jgi:hypothetical protein
MCKVLQAKRMDTMGFIYKSKHVVKKMCYIIDLGYAISQGRPMMRWNKKFPISDPIRLVSRDGIQFPGSWPETGKVHTLLA